MTTPTSGTIGLNHVLTELRVANPGRSATISLGDTDVLALAGVAGPANSLSNLYNKTGSAAFSATGVNDTTTMAGNTVGSTYTGHAFPGVSVSGGTGPYSYSWSITGGSGFTLTSATSANCNVAHTVGPIGFSGTCTLQCMVSDSASHTTTVTGITAVYTP